MNEFTLYSYYRSSAAYRVRIALGLKKIKYDYKAVHLLNNGGEQNSDEYRKLNPSRQVPTLIHNGRALGQSMAIIDYLDGVVAEPRLFPKDPFERAKVIQACEIVNSGIQPIVNLSVLQQLEKDFAVSEDGKSKWSVFWAHKGLLALQDFITPTAGRFCFGDQPSAADCFLMPALFHAGRFKMDSRDYPLLHQVSENCLQLEAFRLAAPGVQPDTP